MAFDLNGSGGDGDIMYDSDAPRRSTYLPLGAYGPLQPASTPDVSNPPELSRFAPPMEAPITTDHMGPQSPLDQMLGKYNDAENAYKTILEKGPEQFKPSIWRRLAGAAIGTGAGIGSQRMGYGRYSGFAANPQEAAMAARSFVFGPQRKMDEAYARQVAGAREGVRQADVDYQRTRQENIDDLQQRNIASEMEARNRPQVVQADDGTYYRVPQEGGPASAITIAPTMPETFGENTQLPQTLVGKSPTSAADAADARLEKSEKFQQEQQQRNQNFQRQQQQDREDRADARQKAGIEQKGKVGLQKVVDDARNIDALEQEQRTILGQVSKPEKEGGGKRGMLGGGPYLNGPQSMQFLANHMALTVGRIKGARTGKDLIEAHIKARDLDQATEALASRVLSGGVLTYEQAQQMLGTTGVKRASAWQKVRETGQDLGVETDDYVPTEYGGKRAPASGQPLPPRPKNVPANATWDEKTRTWNAP